MSKESMLTSGIVVSIAMIVLFVVGSVMRSQIEASIGADAYAAIAELATLEIVR
jgi:hypothetical protein